MMQLTATANVAPIPVREEVTITPLRMDKGAGAFLMRYEPGPVVVSE